MWRACVAADWSAMGYLAQNELDCGSRLFVLACRLSPPADASMTLHVRRAVRKEHPCVFDPLSLLSFWF